MSRRCPPAGTRRGHDQRASEAGRTTLLNLYEPHRLSCYLPNSAPIAQLAHYEAYFSYEANRAYAFDRYGIRVDNPILGLIVGNEENVNDTHVNEAKRSLRSSFEVTDYDTLLRLYLESTC